MYSNGGTLCTVLKGLWRCCLPDMWKSSRHLQLTEDPSAVALNLDSRTGVQLEDVQLESTILMS